MVKNILYFLYAIILGFVAIVTKEIVTFVMLGFVLLALNNIQRTLQDIRAELRKQNQSTYGESTDSQ